ncbi:MAG: MarR family winged helix-turn-helix transcriptional regulator [Oscillospiraceae bacterium]
MNRENKICSEIRITHNMMATFLNRRAKKDDMMRNFTALHGRVLKYLCDHRDTDIFQRDIEEVLAVKRSTATSILKCMEKNGLITRTSVSRDARLKKICLTDRSISIHDHIAQEIKSIEVLARKGISDEELVCFFKVLDKIKSNFMN